MSTGTQMRTESVDVKHVVCTAQLHDGILSHAVARRLDKVNCIFDNKEFRFEQGCLEVPVVRDASSSRLADLCFAVGGRPTKGQRPSGQKAWLRPCRRRGRGLSSREGVIRH